uniref:Uncharacterized protein MANES_15G014400 n=1 Tax=Rhizophora mucronata TaxID=61149 RepID=A0A2P2INH1_RHIMU
MIVYAFFFFWCLSMVFLPLQSSSTSCIISSISFCASQASITIAIFHHTNPKLSTDHHWSSMLNTTMNKSLMLK